MKFVGRLLLVCLALLLCVGAVCAESIVTLPAGLQVIEEEAFLNATGMRHVVVPEGAQEIGPRAFAGSSVKYIRIPASVTVIADDAFEGVTGLTVRGEEGSYAQAWCEVHGVAFTSKDPEPYPESAHPYAYNTDQTWTWTGEATTGWLRVTFNSQTYTEPGYDMIHIHDGRGNLVGTYTGSQLAGRTVAVPGNSVSIRLVSDDYGNKYGFAVTSIEERTDAFQQPVTIKAIHASSATVPMGGAVTWTVQAESAHAPIKYDYVVMRDGMGYTYGTADQPQVTIELWREGSYTLYLAACDVAGNVVTAVSAPVTVLPPALSIDEISANVTATEVGKTIQWCFSVANGQSPISTEVAVMRDGAEVERATLESNKTAYSYVPLETGAYTLSVTVTDASGATATATSAPVTVTEATTAPVTDFQYYLNNENKAVITNYYGTDAYLVIPDTIDGYPVVSIGSKAFTSYYGSDNYKGNEYVQVVVIPDSVETIDEDAFRACANLRRVELGNGVQTIGEEAFAGCVKLERMDFPASVTTLSYGAFADCTSLAEITYPVGLVSSGVGRGPFHGCTSLKKVVVPEGVTMLPSDIFQGVTNLKTVVLPDSLTQVHHYAFEDCTSLKKITLPENVTMVGNRAFAGCTSLTEVNMPEYMESLGAELFDGCTSLRTFRLPLIEWQGTVACIGGPSTFIGTTQLTLIFPEGCTEIYSEQFWGCSSITGVELPSTLETIGVRAFADCANLATVKLHEGLQVIDYYAFYNCTSLRSIYLPSSLKKIDRHAFDGCGSLRISCEWGTVGSEFVQNSGFANDCLGLYEAQYPQGSLPVGEKFTFKGALRALDQIYSLSAGIYNADGTELLQGTIITPMTDFVGLDEHLTGAFKLEELPEGRYVFRMKATVKDQPEKLVVESTFDVVAGEADVITEDLVLPLDVYAEGDTFKFEGSITLNTSKNGSLVARIVEQTTNELVRVYTFEGRMLGEAYNLSEIQDAMDFSGLPVGAYTFRINAYIDGETYTVAESYFRIASKEEEIARAAKVDAALMGVSSRRNNDLLYESMVLANHAYTASAARSNLKALGFQDVESYWIEPGPHTIGHFIGWKDIVDDDGKATRTYIILCRGTAPELNEWMSDFTLASPDGYHHGFYQAALEVWRNFEAYVANHATDQWAPQDYKVWIMGHSRGAAVANILGGALLVDGGYTRSNVFTYTFACPNVYKGDAPAVSNVFNYNIGGDLVPNVPLEAWGYSRYGTTITLKNSDHHFGEELTDYQTMDSLLALMARVELADVLEMHFNEVMPSLNVTTVSEVWSLYLAFFGELAVKAGVDVNNWQNYVELVNDVYATHTPVTYVKWIASITGM